MIETRHKEIQGDNYSVTQFLAPEGLRVSSAILRVVGPSVSAALEGAGDDPTGARGVGQAVAALVQNLDSKLVDEIVRALVGTTRVQVRLDGHLGKPMPLSSVWETHFAGAGLTKLAEWLAFAVEVQFGNFIGWLAGNKAIGSLIPSKEQAESDPPKE